MKGQPLATLRNVLVSDSKSSWTSVSRLTSALRCSISHVNRVGASSAASGSPAAVVVVNVYVT